MAAPKFVLTLDEPLIKSAAKVGSVALSLGTYKSLPVIAIGPKGGKIIGYKHGNVPIYAGSQEAQKLVQLHAAKPEKVQAKPIEDWLTALGIKHAASDEDVLVTPEGGAILESHFGVEPKNKTAKSWHFYASKLYPHVGKPLTPPSDEKTTWAAAVASGEKASEFPDLSTLKKIPAGKFAGSHNNILFQDAKGWKWVFKASDPVIARAEEAAARIGRLILGEKIPPTKVVTVGGQTGVLIGEVPGEPIYASAEQLAKYAAQIVQHQVVDWLTSNHDSHTGNMLADGDELNAIDKGQAWKFFGKDKLSKDYSPNPDAPVYVKFWNAVASGKIPWTPMLQAALEAALDKASAISEDQFKVIIAPYVATRAAEAGPGWDAKGQLEAMTARLTELRPQFESFLSEVLHKPVALTQKKPEPVEVPPASAPAASVAPAAVPSIAAVPTGWPKTKGNVTIKHPGGAIPAKGWAKNYPGPGFAAAINYKEKQYQVGFFQDAENGEMRVLVRYPDDQVKIFDSPNKASDSLYLFEKGLPLDMGATEKKAKGISYPAAKAFGIQTFMQELLGAAMGAMGLGAPSPAAPEPPPPPSPPAEPPSPKTKKEPSASNWEWFDEINTYPYKPSPEAIEEHLVKLPADTVIKYEGKFNGVSSDIRLRKTQSNDWELLTELKGAHLSHWSSEALATHIHWHSLSGVELQKPTVQAALSSETKPGASNWEWFDTQGKPAPISTTGMAGKELSTLAEKLPVGTLLKFQAQPIGEKTKDGWKFSAKMGEDLNPVKFFASFSGKEKFWAFHPPESEAKPVPKNLSPWEDIENKLLELPAGTQVQSEGGEHVFTSTPDWYWKNAEGVKYSAYSAAKLLAEDGGLSPEVALPDTKPAPEPKPVLPDAAKVPKGATKSSSSGLPVGAVITVKKKGLTGTVTLKVTENGFAVRFWDDPDSVWQPFDSLSAASDHVWVRSQGYASVVEYKKATGKTKIPSGGGWKFWGIKPGAAPAAPAPEPAASTPEPETTPTSYGKPATLADSEWFWDYPIYLHQVTAELLDKHGIGSLLKVKYENDTVYSYEKTDKGWIPTTQKGQQGISGAGMVAFLQGAKDHITEAGLKDASAPTTPQSYDWKNTPPGTVYPLTKVPPLEAIVEAPIGTKLQVAFVVEGDTAGGGPSHVYEKMKPNMWENKAGGSLKPNDSIHKFLEQTVGAWTGDHYENKLVAPEQPSALGGGSQQAAKAPGVNVEPVTTPEDAFALLQEVPVGTTWVANSDNSLGILAYEKSGSDTFTIHYQSGAKLEYNIDELVASFQYFLSASKGAKQWPSIDVVGGVAEAAAVAPETPPQPGTSNWGWFKNHSVMDAPEGTKITSKGKLQFKKQAGWWSNNSGEKVDPTVVAGYIENYYSKSPNATVEFPASNTISSEAKPAADAETPPQPGEPNWDWFKTQPVNQGQLNDYFFENAPVGAKLGVKTTYGSAVYTKYDNGWFNNGMKAIHIKLFGTSSYYSNHEFTYIAPETKASATVEVKPQTPKKASNYGPGVKLHLTPDTVEPWAKDKVEAGAKGAADWDEAATDKAHSQATKSKLWPGWVPPPGVLIEGEYEGKKIYLVELSSGHSVQTGEPFKNANFAILTEKKSYSTVQPQPPASALKLAAKKAGLPVDIKVLKKIFGLDKALFAAGESFLTLKAGTGPSAVQPADVVLDKPYENLTPAEKQTTVKKAVPLAQALKVHPLAKKHGSQFTVKPVKGKPEYTNICINGTKVGGSQESKDALEALAHEFGFHDTLINTGGVPKLSSWGGAFMTIPTSVLQQEVTIEVPAQDAAAVTPMPAPMPKGKPKLASDPELEAKKAKIKEAAGWATKHLPVSAPETLHALAHFQAYARSHYPGMKFWARMSADGTSVLLGSEHPEFQKLMKASGLAEEAVETPLGTFYSTTTATIADATPGQPAFMIEGPDGKMYPKGTKFQTKEISHTVEELLQKEPGFYKFKEHSSDASLTVLKVSGNTSESTEKIKAMVQKFGIHAVGAGGSPEPIVGSTDTLYFIPKSELAKTGQTETLVEADSPPQPPPFIPAPFPGLGGVPIGAEVESNPSFELAALSTMKVPQFGHSILMGAPGILRDFQVQARKVKAKDGKTYIEIVGQLNNYDPELGKLKPGAQIALESAMTKPIEDDYTHNYDPDTGYTDETGKNTGTIGTYVGCSGTTYSGSKVEVVKGANPTFDNVFRLRIPEGKDVETEMASAFELMGYDPKDVMAPLGEDGARIYKKWSLVRAFMGPKGWHKGLSSPKEIHDESWLDQQLKKYKAAHLVDTATIRQTFQGTISVVLDDADRFKKAGWDYVFRSDGNAGSLFYQIYNGVGWASRKHKYLNGSGTGGWSASADIHNGGATGCFFRIGKAQYISSDYTIVAHPRVFQRADWWRYNSDNYGTISNQGNGSIGTGLSREDTNVGQGSNEIMFQGGIAFEDVMCVVVPNTTSKNALIKRLNDVGVTEANGVPLKDFILDGDHDIQARIHPSLKK